MKKVISFIISFIISVSLVGCNNDSTNKDKEENTAKVEQTKNNDLGINIKDKGNCSYYITTGDITSQNNAIPYIYLEDDTQLMQIGYVGKEFDSSKLSYIYIDGELQEKMQLSDDCEGTLTLQGNSLKVGKHKVEVVQYNGTESKNVDDILIYKSAEYVITNNEDEFTNGNEKAKKVQSKNSKSESSDTSTKSKTISTDNNKSNTTLKTKSSNKSKNNSNKTSTDAELPDGGYYVTCPECGRKIWTINGDWDCGCENNNNNNDNDNDNSIDDEENYDNEEETVTCLDCGRMVYINNNINLIECPYCGYSNQ